MFKNKRVTIMGLGLNDGGVGVAKFFCQQGAKVLVTDLRTKEQLEKSISKLRGFGIEYVLGHHRQEDFINTDLVIRNPGVPKESYFLKVARENKVPVETDMTIFFGLCPAPIIGVTGTKGKSTTATLIYLFLKKKFPNAILAGNIGVSPLEILAKVKKNSKVVLELSSFELEDLQKSPQIAVITNIMPDHLNRYKDMEEYVDAKKNIFRFQKTKDFLFLNSQDRYSREFAKEACSKIVCFEPGKFSAATEVAKFLKIPEKDIQKISKNFKGVANRQEFIVEVGGVKYFNDTTATMPEACIYAIRNFNEKFPKSKLILIAGGQDKNLDYKNLAMEIQKSVDYLVLLPGTASEKIKSGLHSFVEVETMQEAVQKASQFAKAGDIVILSPAAASFNLFKNEFDRGDQFVEIVKNLNAE